MSHLIVLILLSACQQAAPRPPTDPASEGPDHDETVPPSSDTDLPGDTAVPPTGTDDPTEPRTPCVATPRVQVVMDLQGADAEISGVPGNSLLGTTVARAGDINGDGFDDLVTCASYDPASLDAGACYLFYGPITGPLDISSADVTFWGANAWDFMNEAAGAGDLDGDGFDDLVLGSPRHDDRGAVFVFYGPIAPGSISVTAADAKLRGEQIYSMAGYSVASAGDVNGDGLDDLVIGSHWLDRVYIVYGPVTTGKLADADAILYGPSGSFTGLSVAGVGDLDGDGFDDVAVGAPDAYPAGEVYIVNGPIAGAINLTSMADAVLLGEHLGDKAGHTVAGVGDINGDGFDDLAVGAPLSDVGADQSVGRAYLYLGPLTGSLDLANADATFVGEAKNDQAAYQVAGAGDLDGDGCDDLVIGSRYHDAALGDEGATYVMYGPLAGAFDLVDAHWKIVGNSTYDLAGMAVAGLGDVTGDGVPDLGIGAPGQAGGGAAYIVSGRP